MNAGSSLLPNHQDFEKLIESSFGDYFAGQYKSIAGYAARFALYNLDERGGSAFDPENIVVDNLWRVGMPKDATIVDMGTADGHFLDLLALNGFYGTVIGIDPNTKQFDTDEAPALTLSCYPKVTKLLIEGHANDVRLADGSVDVFAAQFMLYHLADTDGAILEAKRVLKPNGLFVVTTSGINNKFEHRQDEAEVAALLTKITGVDTLPPAKMNDGYTTGRAMYDLPRFFSHVYARNYESRAVLRSLNERVIYGRSLLSLYDQFRPKPELDAFVEAVETIALQGARKFVAISRSAFICSDGELSNIDDSFQELELAT